MMILQIYTRTASQTASDCTLKSGIVDLCPRGTLTHDELFDPCGYSMNGLVAGKVEAFLVDTIVHIAYGI